MNCDISVVIAVHRTLLLEGLTFCVLSCLHVYGAPFAFNLFSSSVAFYLLFCLVIFCSIAS